MPPYLDLLEDARLLHSFQIVNGRRPDQISAALEGEHVGTIVHADRVTSVLDEVLSNASRG